MNRILLCLAIITGCASPAPTPPRQPVATPTFDDHCLTCRQCGGGLLDDNGEEQGLCEEGFRLWQADLRAGKGL